MKRYEFNDGDTLYTRITKTEAKRMFDAGEPFYIIAHKMRPGFPFSMGMIIDGDHIRAERSTTPTYPTVDHFFDATVTEFCFHNANCHETGTYAAYYRMNPVRKAEVA